MTGTTRCKTQRPGMRPLEEGAARMAGRRGEEQPPVRTPNRGLFFGSADAAQARRHGRVEPRADRALDRRRVEAGLREELLAAAVIEEPVGETELQQRRGDAVRREELRDAAAGAAGD